MVHRLVLHALLPRLASVLVACLAIFGAVEVVDLANVASGPPLHRYPLRLPHAFVLVSPVVTLIGAAWATAHLLRTGQLLGLASCGADLRRALAAVPLVGIGVGALSFASSAWLAPLGIAAWATGHEPIEGPVRWVVDGSSLRRFPSSEGGGDEGFLAFELDDSGLPLLRTEAERVVGEERGLRLEEVRVAAPGEAPTRAASARVAAPAPAPPGAATPERLTWAGLRDELRRARSTAADAAPVEAEMGLRAALALACPACALLGLLAAFVPGRRIGVTAVLVAASGLVLWLLLAGTWVFAVVGQASWWQLGFGPACLVGLPATGAWLLVAR